ncbi:PREDICTED: probable choline kinase 3 [Ipomoea nil]|uniref:probable choline kinase 3 n=1 Tax=Ipomoea nil TaxID=35883 RepID=UPI000901EEA1|nr:PREDICTED: probable choline kinase 3 [Ipomoea nil]
MAVKKDESVEGSLPGELMQLVLSIASKWGDDDTDPDTINVELMSGAMTNAVFQISWPAKTEKVTRRVLGRVYGVGVEHFFDRVDEIRTFEFLSSKGHGPKLLGKSAEGRIEQFIEARTLSADDLRDPEVSTLIAGKLRQFHSIVIPGTTKEVVLWNRLRKWLEKAKRLCSTEQTTEFRLGDLENEISLLEKELSREPPEIGFCHNDLQYGNIMIENTARLITFIDYEYATYNPIAYDFANHFCEMAANYHTHTPHVLDYSRYPGSEERHRFISSYLSSSGNHPSDEEVEKLAVYAEKYTLANHLFWGLWGAISANVNTIDFKYLEYSRQRFEQYWLRKPELLGISGDDL